LHEGKASHASTVRNLSRRLTLEIRPTSRGRVHTMSIEKFAIRLVHFIFVHLDAGKCWNYFSIWCVLNQSHLSRGKGHRPLGPCDYTFQGHVAGTSPGNSKSPTCVQTLVTISYLKKLLRNLGADALTSPHAPSRFPPTPTLFQVCCSATQTMSKTFGDNIESGRGSWGNLGLFKAIFDHARVDS